MSKLLEVQYLYLCVVHSAFHLARTFHSLPQSRVCLSVCLSVLPYSIIPKRKGRDNGSIHIPNQDHPRMVIGILKYFSATAGDNTSARSGSQGLSFYKTEDDAKTAGCRLFDSGWGIPAADSARNRYGSRQ